MTTQYLSILDSHGKQIPLSAVSGVFEGAATGRRMGMWGTSNIGPNSAIFNSLGTLRSRSREMIRNNPLVDGGTDSYVSDIIGSGINPRWQIDDPVLKKDIHDLWDDFVLKSDFSGQSSFYGQQSLVARGMIDAGEILARKVPRRMEEGLPVPLQIQLLEADHLDEVYNTITDNGNEVRMGIEIDADGRRQAYWLWPEHPGEAFIMRRNLGERIRIPADKINHVYRPLRAGQMRGRPWLSSIIIKLHDLDRYDDAELVRKKVAAMYGGFIKQQTVAMDPSSFFGKKDADKDEIGQDVIALEPGTFPVLPPGMDVQFSQPTDVGGSYEVWIKQQLRQIAKGMGITYEQLTGDLSGVNYSSIRAGLLQFRRRVQQIQFETIIFQFCQPVAEAFLDAAVGAGILKITDYYRNRRRYLRIKWRPDGWAWVDPEKDLNAEETAVRAGFKSRSQVVAERGGDVETVDREIAEDNTRADQLGLVYDTDPRKVGKTAADSATKKAAEQAPQTA
jgi:lambda family phage portal protein